MIQEVPYLDIISLATDKLANGGVFLSVGGERPNTMTIGWGSIGFYWGKPILTAVVRPSRYTFKQMLESDDFTVSVPLDNALRKQLGFAGTASGRDVDKFEGHGLTAAPAQVVDAPIVAECGLHLECRTLLRQDMTTERMHPQVVQIGYAKGDLHTMFFAEILKCYRTK